MEGSDFGKGCVAQGGDSGNYEAARMVAWGRCSHHQSNEASLGPRPPSLPTRCLAQSSCSLQHQGGPRREASDPPVYTDRTALRIHSGQPRALLKPLGKDCVDGDAGSSRLVQASPPTLREACTSPLAK